MCTDKYSVPFNRYLYTVISQKIKLWQAHKKMCLLSTAYSPRKKKPYCCWLKCVCVYVCGLSSATFSHQVGHKPLPLAPSNALALYVMPGLSAGIQRSWKPFFLTFRPANRSHNCHFLYHAKKKKPTILVQKSIKENVGLQIVLPKFLHSVAVLMYFHITTCINHYVMLCWLPVIWNP